MSRIIFLSGLILVLILFLLTACAGGYVATATPGAPSPSASKPPAITPSPSPSVSPSPAASISASPVVITPVVTTPITSPLGTPTPGNKAVSTPEGQRTVTLADDGKTIELQTGERFLLSLGTGFDWTVTVDDPSVVSRVVNITVVQGAQGVYEAKKHGRTTLTATGDPPCRKAQPPCGAPSRLFKVDIIVR